MIRNTPSKLNKIVLRVVFIYLVFGLLWIFLSDRILSSLVLNHAEFVHFGTYKGLAFVAATSCLLFFLLSSTLKRQMKIEESLKISEERWKFALEGAGDGVWDWNLQTDEVFRSARWHQIFGYEPSEIGNTATEGRKLIHPDDFKEAIDHTQASLNGITESYVSEFRMLCKDGSWKWVLARGMLVSRTEDGKPLRMIGTHTDISAHKKSEAQIFRLAHYDQVTKLPNRVLFLDRFEQDIKKAHRNQQTVTLLFLDLDHFKEINDTLGHDMGDLLLKETAVRLLACVRDNDTVARLGGDEFTIILNDLDQQSNTEIVTQKILEKIAEPFQLGDELVYISTSIGISIYPEDGQDVDVLLKNADQAMYAAKDQGRNRYYYFKHTMQEAALKRMRVTSDLRIALAADQFRVYYQPILALATNRLYKAEALIRWQHPTMGLVSPNEFIPVAEDSGLIIDIGDWVFRQAATQVAKWRESRPDFQVSVNKSPAQFRASTHKVLNWIEFLDSLGLNGNSIAVEITEGLLLDARDTVEQQLSELRAAGMQISIDDFGTGYSSLAYLRKFHIDYVKIDRSFTANIAPASSDMALCEAIIVMAHKLGMKVIAEGIETQEQLDLLVEAGCDYGQGYLFSKPLPVDEFEKLFLQQAIQNQAAT